MYLDGDDRMLADANGGEDGFQVEVPVGDTVITVKVTAEDGSTMQTYTVTVTVTQPPSSDATLRDLVLSHGTTVVPLTPGFMPETKAYTATVDSAVTQGTVTATPNYAGAHIMYLDGDDRMLADANGGEDGFQVEVPVGDTVITVKVTAEDGSTMQTYTVTVTVTAAVNGRDVARPCPESRDDRGAIDAGVHAGDESIHGDGRQRRDPGHGDGDAELCRSAHHVPGW